MSIESRKHQYGKVFDHWQIKNSLGGGIHGKTLVFRLEHTESPGMESALKVVNLIEERGSLEKLSSKEKKDYEAARGDRREKAEKEVRAMDTLKSKTNIVDYQDHTFVNWSDETGFGQDMLIRMELLTDLRYQIKNEKKQFSRSEIIAIGKDIATALILCHEKGIMHRDVKPENIFVNKDGDYKLGDFGISRILQNRSSSVAGTSIGTPEYMAPEQFSVEYDKRVDIYSLGLVLYEFANGNRLPFAKSSYITEEENHRRLLGEALPTPCCADHGLAQVILKACAFDAKDRFQTAAELRSALEMLEESESSAYATSFAIPNFGGYGTKPANSRENEQENSYIPKKTGYCPDKLNHPQKENANNKKKKYLTVLLAVVAALAALLFLKPFECREHDWKEATCTTVRECRECGEKEGAPLGHVWTAATCTQPETCSSCGATSGNALGHTWEDATCTAAKTCKTCAAVDGEPLDHIWKEATYTDPETCSVCSETRGSRLVADPIYLNELGVSYHEGKIWTRSQNAPSGSYHTNSDARSNSPNARICWSNWITPGHTSGTVKDQAGNKYTYGIFIDGSESQDYYMEFNLDGKYTTFSGTCACPDRDSAISSYVYYNASTLYSKYFDVYLDGEYKGSSPSMRADYRPQEFEFDVIGGQTLKIVYPATDGPNEIASIYDGMLK